MTEGRVNLTKAMGIEVLHTSLHRALHYSKNHSPQITVLASIIRFLSVFQLKLKCNFPSVLQHIGPSYYTDQSYKAFTLIQIAQVVDLMWFN